jgi:asparagine synthase (glutamine-hydrolysing)
MCGISGYFSVTGRLNFQDLELMVEAQRHRGPDSQDTFVHEKVGLGHNRLSIIDLSERGNQPMTSHSDRYVIVYNGEVYNFGKIATHLKFHSSETFNFKSASDTEVILEAFSRYGPASVELLNGMFAFAIYDKQEEELFLFRDRLGIKPLFYFWDGYDLVFSSEVKTMKKLKKLDLKVNYSSIPQYLNLGYIPAPYTIYENCYKLEPGHYIKFKKNAFKKIQYWSVSASLSDKVVMDEKKAIVLVSDLLASSVQYQMKSDVPYGVFLSGGIDSSLITANAVRLSGTKINTFSIGFENQNFNEASYARKIAEHLGTHHHEFTVTTKDAIDSLDDYMNAYGEPFADSSGIPTLLISGLAKKHVSVTLSGDGGDELFQGYGSYKWARKLDNLFIHHNRFLLSKILSKSSSDRNKRAALMFDYSDKEMLSSHIFSQEQYFFTAREIAELLKKSYLSPVLLDKLQRYTDAALDASLREQQGRRVLFPAEKQAIYDLKFYLPDDLLVKIDRASMHYSLETRVPYLDHRLVEQALNVSLALKSKPHSKYILKEILYQYVPQSYFNRPKQGFSIPLKLWLKNEMRYLLDDYLNESTVKMVGVIEYEYVKKLLRRFEAGEEFLFQRVWLLINLHRWYLKNIL